MNHRIACAFLLMVMGCEGDQKISDTSTPSEGWDGSGGGSSDGGSGGGDDGSGDGACTTDDDCGSGQICEDEVCVTGDRNNDFEEADPLRFVDGSDESARTTGVINPVGDRDYYAFEADAGDFVRVTSYTDEEDETKDTVVTILRDNGRRLTYANGHAAGGGVSDADSVVYAYIPEAGTYYVLVEDDGTFYEDAEPEGGADYTYSLALTEWTSHTAETDSAESPSSTITISSDRSWSARGVALETAGDVDYIAINLEIDDYDLFVDGNYDLEGSDADPRVRLIDPTSGTVLRDKRQNGLSGSIWYPRLPMGQYLLELSDAAGGGGVDHWFYVHTIAREGESTYAWETESNDTMLLAETLEQEPIETSSGNEYTVSRREGLADVPGDEDWYALTSEYEDGRLVVCLNSTWYGATTAPTVEVYDATGTRLDSVEGESDSAVYPTATLANLSAPSGTYYVRVQHAEDVGGTAGDWYRLLVFLASFEVTNYDCP